MTTDGEDFEAIARELFAAPLDDFTSQRNARVKELRAAGSRDLAAQVEKVRRPSVPLWAANKLATSAVLATVKEAATAAEKAQAEGAASALREAGTQLQRALDGVGRAAATILTEGGHNAADTTTSRVREIVRGAALSSGDEWDRLLSGSLLQEPEAQFGLGPTPSAQASPEAPASKHVRKAPDAGALREARRSASTDARAAVRAVEHAQELREQADELVARASEAEKRAAAAEDEAAQAATTAAASQAAVEALEQDED